MRNQPNAIPTKETLPCQPVFMLLLNTCRRLRDEWMFRLGLCSFSVPLISFYEQYVEMYILWGKI